QVAEIKARVQTRIDRIELGNFGDYKGVGEGVFELRIDCGPGYRVYYGLDSKTLVILLVEGTKKQQARTIKLARTYWKLYKEEKHDARKRP
ncbi:MAG: type II toxin-antitoxin system RelE/ParE family toxin, partial [Nitrospira sp.]|nr:type II toxin-antitoxin system RelE/ParE family toxin [Nitrospira sp.]